MPISDNTDKTVLLVQIEHDGLVGWGEAAPISYYRQSFDSAEAALAKMKSMLGNDPFALDAILDNLLRQFPGESAAIAAVDGALHDLIGKILKVPLWKMFGLDRSRMPLTCITIGLDTPEVIAAKVREAAAFPILKIKVGTPDDETTLKVIRREAPNKTLRVDANCGWTSDNVFERCRMMADAKVEFVEQPTKPGDNDALPRVREAGLGPLFADESCVTVKDVLYCVGFFDGINIKLSKCGGIRQAMKMIHIARAAGLKIMLGCMVETSVGISAAAQLGPLVDHLDLDGHLLLANDPFTGLGGDGGRLTLTEEPGLGIKELVK
jgi:L-alanine-DL-glutamate epimerase-like enolase superfamily enzyme